MLIIQNAKIKMYLPAVATALQAGNDNVKFKIVNSLILIFRLGEVIGETG